MRFVRCAASVAVTLMVAIALPACSVAAHSHGTPLGMSDALSGRDSLTASQPQSVSTPGTRTPGNPHGHAYVPPAARAVSTSSPTQVIGDGNPAGCTSAAVVSAVARGGIITFNCGPNPVTITMTATAKVVNTSHLVVLDGGGLITLSGGGQRQILYMDTCDERQIWTTNHCIDQQWPQLVVQNMNFEDGYSAIQQTPNTPYGGGGGGAIYAEGGQLKVVNSEFINNRCYSSGPDLGGAAIRAITPWSQSPVYITSDTFIGGVCSNGGALSSIAASWDVLNSVLENNQAIGWGANPAKPGTPGGGSGGAIYNDGDNYNLSVAGTLIENNTAREGGGAIFFVVDNNQGTLTIAESTLSNNPTGQFFTYGYPGIFFHSSGRPIVTNSTIN
jgi:predicted outer membrane repeat protein